MHARMLYSDGFWVWHVRICTVVMIIHLNRSHFIYWLKQLQQSSEAYRIDCLIPYHLFQDVTLERYYFNRTFQIEKLVLMLGQANLIPSHQLVLTNGCRRAVIIITITIISEITNLNKIQYRSSRYSIMNFEAVYFSASGWCRDKKQGIKFAWPYVHRNVVRSIRGVKTRDGVSYSALLSIVYIL